MPTITYLYQPNEIVYAIHDNKVQRGTVTKVEIVHSLTQSPTVKYYVRLDGQTTTTELNENQLYSNCKATNGYQEVIFTRPIAPLSIAFNVAPPPGLSTVINIDNVPYNIVTSLGINATFEDVLNEINSIIGTSGSNVGTVSINNGKLRITSHSKGELSTVIITDTIVGSPITSYGYFSEMYRFSGFAASTGGLSEGALEALGNSIC